MPRGDPRHLLRIGGMDGGRTTFERQSQGASDGIDGAYGLGRGITLAASAIVLAGGRSARLGSDKPTLLLHGKALLQRVGDAMSQLSDDVIVVQRQDQCLALPGARVVSDLEPFSGPLAGIAAGLGVARHSWAFVVACDMPFLNADLLHYMLDARDGHDAVVPKLTVGLEPLHALYHVRCLPALMNVLIAGKRRVTSFYETLDVRFVTGDEISRFDPQGRSFFNVNTERDLELARSWDAEAPG